MPFASRSPMARAERGLQTHCGIFPPSNLPETEKICASPARGLRALQPVWVSARNREKIVFARAETPAAEEARSGDSRNERSPQEKKPVAKEVSGVSPAAKE